MSDTHRCCEYSNVICDSFSDNTNHNEINYDDFNRQAENMQSRINELEKAILEVLDDHGDLADGDVCTLIKLKRVMGL